MTGIIICQILPYNLKKISKINLLFWDRYYWYLVVLLAIRIIEVRQLIYLSYAIEKSVNGIVSNSKNLMYYPLLSIKLFL